MPSFKGRHFPQAIILMAVRCYVAYALSYRDIEELMSERGVKLDHATVQRWVAEYSPELMGQARKVMTTSAGSWRMDETCIKVKGQWLYLYRVVDKFGNTIDVMLSRKARQARSHAVLHSSYRAIRYRGRDDVYAHSGRDTLRRRSAPWPTDSCACRCRATGVGGLGN